MKKIQITDFSKRHFDPNFKGTKIKGMSIDEFEGSLNDIMSVKSLSNLKNGYADFCKLLVVENFTETKTGTVPITLENLPYMRSGYSSRTKNELPVLSTWMELPKKFVPIANFLVIVLYDREQLLKEHLSNPENTVSSFEIEETTEYGVVAILAQMGDNEEPMKPITMMRNSLGIEEGGSGFPIDKEKYNESVEFWSNNSMVK